MKQYAEIIAECAYDTGYDFEFLCEMVSGMVREGNSYDESVSCICGSAYERDF